MQKNNRKIEFDIAKAIVMYLVIVGHVIQYIIAGDYSHNPVWQFIYVFHVPLFFIIGGYFLKINILTDSMGGKIVSYFKHLVQPTLVVGFIATVVLLAMSMLFRRQLVDYTKLYSLIVLDCWYLKSQFAVFFILYCIGFIRNKYVKILALSVVFIMSAFYINDLWYVSYSMPFILFGNMLRKVYDKLETNRFYLYALIFIVLLMTFFWRSEYLYYFAPYNMSLASICHNMFRITYAIAVCLLIILALKRMSVFIPTEVLDKLLSVGQNTLVIYLLQFLIIERILCYAHFSTGSIIVDNAILVPISSVVILILLHKAGVYLTNNSIASKILSLQR